MTSSVTAPAPRERWLGPAPLLGSRELFPDLEFGSYLAHAAISPLNQRVSAAARACLEDVARSGAASFLPWDLQRQRLRDGLSALLGAPTGQIALTPGTTRGITDVALGLPWQPGDVLVTFAGEFPANVTPWQRAAAVAGGEIRFLSPPDLGSLDPGSRILEELRQELAAGARYVAVSAVQFQTGFAMPLREIGVLCRLHGARFLVDGIQACGVLPVDVEALGIDALACGAHKWLLGLEGAGFLYVRSDFCSELRALTAGWLSHEDGDLFLFRGAGELLRDRPLKSSAPVFEGSSQNAVGFAALEAGLSICQELGPSVIFEHVQAFLDEMEPVWTSRGFRSLRSRHQASRSCILSLELPTGVPLAQLARALRERGVMVSTPDGYLRIAPHFSNDRSEIPFVEAALEAAIEQVRA